MVDVPTRTLLDYLNSLPSGGVGGAVTRDLTIRDDLATGQQAVPPGGSTGEVLVKLSDGDFDTGWTPAGSGTVQTITVDTANGFTGASDGDPSNPTLTLSTTVTGLLRGDGTAISAATGGTDYLVPGGDLGTPSAGVLTNATGLPISTGVSGLGAGVATFLATPTSANLAAAVTGETGSGALVFATSPALVTPNIGAATGTSLALTGALSTSGGALTVSGTGTSTIAGPLNIAGAAAGQIVFPATQNPSSNANTLDDYEEGTWTPNWTSASGSPSYGNATVSTSYVKIGSLVFASVQITMGSTTTYGTGLWRFTLPFTATTPSVGAASVVDAGTLAYPAICRIPLSSLSSGVLLEVTGGTVAPTVPFTWTTNDVLSFSIFYSV